MKATIKLSNQDFNDILESLHYTKKAKEEYKNYPDTNYKNRTIEDTEALIIKIKKLREETN